ncbi:MAG TPA: adenylyl-sulfate kinase, partial [Opitutus sp.]|nr:adenylyl-sulfate kinase [Opitutus sp.]
EITLRARQIVGFDDHQHLSISGRFALVEGRLCAGGGIVLPGAYHRRVSGGPAPVENLFFADGKVTRDRRARRNGHSGRVVWFTGLSASGKSTLAIELERQLFNAGRQVYFLDGDNLRHGLCAGLGFSATDRTENIRRAAEAAKLFADAGIICLAAFISPLRADRDRARSLLEPGKFIEVHVATPVEVCRQRDPKGLYARADRGEIKEFTGVTAPYEPPEKPEIVLHPERESVDACVTRLLEFLAEQDNGSFSI